MELTIAQTITNGDERALWSTVLPWVSDALQGIGIGFGSYSHIMYIVPDSVDFQGFAALAYIGW